MLKYKCLIFDLDGTIYFGDKLAESAKEVIEVVRKKCEYVFFLTNNSAKTRKEIQQKLLSLGINVTEREVVTASYVIAKYLKDNRFKNIYCLGTKSLKQELTNSGLNLVTDEPDAIVVGYNKEFKLSDIDEMLNIKLGNNYKIISANKERIYPSSNGKILSGAGAIVAAVEFVLNQKTDIIIGKPNPLMLNLILSGLSIEPSEVLVIGDSYESDIKMADEYGAKSILISNDNSLNCFTIRSLKDLLEVI